MIVRIWHGWTTHENADKYDKIVRTEVFAKVEEKEIPGYRGYQMLRKTHATETEFISMIWFDKLENVSDFAGADYERAHIPDACAQVLKRYQEKAEHFEVASSRSIST